MSVFSGSSYKGALQLSQGKAQQVWDDLLMQTVLSITGMVLILANEATQWCAKACPFKKAKACVGENLLNSYVMKCRVLLVLCSYKRIFCW